MTFTDPFMAPGRNRPAPSPAALALLAQCKRAKAAADAAPRRLADTPVAATATAAGGEVTFVVHPQCLADWVRWTAELGLRDVRRMSSTGSSMVVRFTYAGVPARLVGVGVPALIRAASVAKGARRV
jgi:hypothetical protein